MSRTVDAGSRAAVDEGSLDAAQPRTRLDGQFMRRRVRRFTWRSKCWRISLAPGALRHANPAALAAQPSGVALDICERWS
jgi:hypothetical protein